VVGRPCGVWARRLCVIEGKVRSMRPETRRSRVESLGANAHLPEVQAVISDEIARGAVRVIPAPGGGIRIISADGTSPVAEPEPDPAPPDEPGIDAENPRKPVLRIKRLRRPKTGPPTTPDETPA
jgi:hypothetical protein